MNFSTWAALAVGLIVAAPVAAHLLQRGRTQVQVFPALALVPSKIAHSRERARLRDRALLLLRAAMILLLAILGATPLVQCSDLAIARPQGESIALAIVLDDSHSMRALAKDGSSRWELAKLGSLQLLGSLREGDSVAITLAGSPARMALAPTSDRNAADETIRSLQVSDRASSLEDAVKLARSAIQPLQQPNHQVVAFSDLSGSNPWLAEASQTLITPLPTLRQPLNDCAILSAQRMPRRLALQVACSPSARGNRSLIAIEPDTNANTLRSIDELAQLVISAQPGLQTLSIALETGTPSFDLSLTPPDDNPSNDVVAVSELETGLVVAIAAEPKPSGVLTGGATLLERAVRAVRPTASVRPLTELPTEADAFNAFAAVLVDNPAGFSPDERRALIQWLEGGGVALGLLGPAVNRLALAASLEPFATHSVRWTSLESSLGLKAESLNFLASQAASLASLAPRGRVQLDTALEAGSELLGRWQDDAPFLLRRPIGAGLVLTAGLSTSLEESNFALRPGFLALIKKTLQEANQRRGPSASPVGSQWAFSGQGSLSVVGAAGSLELNAPACLDGSNCSAGTRIAVPERAGRYFVERDGRIQVRLAQLSASEITDPPGLGVKLSSTQSNAGAAASVDASSQASFLLLLLFALELATRAWRQAVRKDKASLLA